MSGFLGSFWKAMTCQNYMELASKNIDKPLSGKDKLVFGLHHLICTFCRRSNRQIRLLDKASDKLFAEPIEGEAQLSVEARDRIQRSLESDAS